MPTKAPARRKQAKTAPLTTALAPALNAQALPSGPAVNGAAARPGIDLARQSREQRFNPLRNVTPARLGNALDSFHAGYLRDASLIWDGLEDRVGIIKTCAGKRKKDISRRPWEIVMIADKDQQAAAEAHKEALEDFFNHLTVTDATDLNVQGGMSLLIRQMMDAQLKKYAAHEIVWRPSADGLRAELRFVPLYLFENRRGRLAYTGINGYSEGAICLPGEWMITCGDGLMEAVSVAWMFMSLSLKDWLTFSEKFGMPGVHMELNAAVGSTEWDNGLSALQNFANEWVIMTTTGAKVNLIETGKTGDAPFKPMVDHMERTIATLFRGADLSTISKQEGAGASLQGDESNLLQQDDCELCSDVINQNLTRAVIALMFGPGVEPLAYLKIKPENPRDTKLDMEVDKHLRELGVPMSEEDVLERYSRTRPDDDETLIEPKKEELVKGQPSKVNGDDPDPDDEVIEEEEEDPALDNAQRDADFLASARELIARSGITDRTPLITELTEILALENAQEQDVRLAEFIGALPEAIGNDAVLIEAWEQILGSAFLNGCADLDEAAALDNANPNHDRRGRFARAREIRTGRTQDTFGELPHADMSDEDNLKRGQKSVRWAVRNQSGITRAMWRKELGAIDFPWGTPGRADLQHVGGYGLSHIIAKHGEADALKLPEAILHGEMHAHPESQEKKLIIHGGYVAVLGLQRSKRRNWWSVTGFTEKQHLPPR